MYKTPFLTEYLSAAVVTADNSGHLFSDNFDIRSLKLILSDFLRLKHSVRVVIIIAVIYEKYIKALYMMNVWSF